MLKFVYIQNFELILDILDHTKPSIFSLKQAGKLAACYLEKTPVFISLCPSVNRDFCGHSRFVLWHQNLTTFVSWTLAKSDSLGEGGWP